MAIPIVVFLMQDWVASTLSDRHAVEHLTWLRNVCAARCVMLQRSTRSEGLFRRAQQTGPLSQVWPQLVKHLMVSFACTRVLLEAAPSP